MRTAGAPNASAAGTLPVGPEAPAVVRPPVSHASETGAPPKAGTPGMPPADGGPPKAEPARNGLGILRNHREKLRLIVAEDEELYRNLLVRVLSTSGNVEVVGAFADGQAALEATRRLHPRVVLLDIELAGSLNGVQIGLIIQREFPDVGVVWLSAHSRPYLPVSSRRGLTAGWGYLLKRSVADVRSLVDAIDAVSRGLVLLDPEIARSMDALLKEWMPRLSASQFDVLALMAQGLGNKAIAETLHVTEKSVENHINHIYQLLRVDRRAAAKQPRVQAVLAFLRGRVPQAPLPSGA